MRNVNWNDLAWLLARKKCSELTLLKYAAWRMSFQSLLQLLYWVLLKYPLSIDESILIREGTSLWPCLHDAKHLGKNWNHYTSALMLFRHSALWHCKGRQFRFFQFSFWYLSLCSYSQWLDKCMFTRKKVWKLYIW